MKRYYYLSDDIRETVDISNQLSAKGISRKNLHVYGLSDEVATQYGLNTILSVFRSDVIHYILRGFILGCLLTGAAWLAVGIFFPELASYLPMVVLVGFLLTGFISWEAGLIGLHKVNYKLVPLTRMLGGKRHIIVLDVNVDQVYTLIETLNEHKKVKMVAIGSSLVNPFSEQETILG